MRKYRRIVVILKTLIMIYCDNLNCELLLCQAIIFKFCGWFDCLAPNVKKNTDTTGFGFYFDESDH